MMTLDKDGNYIPWVQPEYGHDAQERIVPPPAGHEILPEGKVILEGDVPFDVYSGWMRSDGWDWVNHCHARSDGRWTTWARPLRSNEKS